MTNNRHIELELRRNRGRLVREDWKRQFAAIGIALTDSSFVDLARSDQLSQSMSRQLTTATEKARHQVHASEISRLYAKIEQAAGVLGRELICLSTYASEHLGLIQLEALPILSRPKVVHELVKRDLCLFSATEDGGICLELDFYGDDGQHVPEGACTLSSWGRLKLSE